MRLLIAKQYTNRIKLGYTSNTNTKDLNNIRIRQILCPFMVAISYELGLET